jgi:hypothetical protein
VGTILGTFRLSHHPSSGALAGSGRLAKPSARSVRHAPRRHAHLKPGKAERARWRVPRGLQLEDSAARFLVDALSPAAQPPEDVAAALRQSSRDAGPRSSRRPTPGGDRLTAVRSRLRDREAGGHRRPGRARHSYRRVRLGARLVQRRLEGAADHALLDPVGVRGGWPNCDCGRKPRSSRRKGASSPRSPACSV